MLVQGYIQIYIQNTTLNTYILINCVNLITQNE